MRKESTNIVLAIQRRVASQRVSAITARNDSLENEHRIMLSGKVKAYTDILLWLEGRYKLGRVKYPLRKKL